MTDRLFKGTGLQSTLKELTDGNKDEWFKNVKQIAFREDYEFVLGYSYQEYCVVWERTTGNKAYWPSNYTQYLTGIVEEQAEQRILLLPTTRTKPNLQQSVILQKQYRKGTAVFILNLERKISLRDKKRIENTNYVQTKIKKLYNKYYKTKYYTSNTIIKRFYTQEINTNLSLSNNFIELEQIRTEAYRQTPRNLFSDCSSCYYYATAIVVCAYSKASYIFYTMFSPYL